MTASPGDVGGVGLSPPPSIQYQWQRCDTGGAKRLSDRRRQRRAELKRLTRAGAEGVGCHHPVAVTTTNSRRATTGTAVRIRRHSRGHGDQRPAAHWGERSERDRCRVGRSAPPPVWRAKLLTASPGRGSADFAARPRSRYSIGGPAAYTRPAAQPPLHRPAETAHRYTLPDADVGATIRATQYTRNKHSQAAAENPSTSARHRPDRAPDYGGPVRGHVRDGPAALLHLKSGPPTAQNGSQAGDNLVAVSPAPLHPPRERAGGGGGRGGGRGGGPPPPHHPGGRAR